ncbi:DUF1631 domain-containing protein [Leeia sp. TBRC 13508]|uniref:DUF1631 domain-containing protein n=1 Tax=Leeia speluncae TaxID=2884804 RepID=A0ABS8D4V1_9NEIS|nr:DUF1631 family protein [Leeia speluncae]MCB6183225.1 DUF1631 domain-containing protein [Leeia speluncae]
MKKTVILNHAQQLMLSGFETALPSVLSSASESLFLAAEKEGNPITSGHFLDARALLTQQQSPFMEDCAIALKALSQGFILSAYAIFTPSRQSKTIKADKLSLIDTNSFEEELLVEDLTNIIGNQVHTELREMDIRMANLFDQPDILPRENPFRPYVFAHAILTAIEPYNPPRAIKDQLVLHLLNQLIPAVRHIYVEINAFFAAENISDEMTLRIKKSIDTEDASANQMRASAPVESETDHLQSNISQLGDEFEQILSAIKQEKAATENVASFSPTLKTQPPRTKARFHLGSLGKAFQQFFQGEAPVATASPSDTSHSSIHQPLLAEIHQQIQVAGAAGKETQPNALLDNKLVQERGKLRQLASSEHEKVTIDLIAILFELILSDLDVPAEIRAQIGRLQFVVLKLALKDSALLNNKKHPARLLVNQLGSASLKLNEVDPTGEKLIEVVKGIINQLVEDNGEHIEKFSEQLETLSYFIQTQLALSNHLAKVEAHLNEAAERSKHYVQIRANLLINHPIDQLEKVAQDFLLNTWSKVLEENAKHPHPESKELIGLTSNLIWSLTPKRTTQDRAMLFKQIPTMNELLKTGLGLINEVHQQHEAFFKWLVSTHMKSLRPTEGATLSETPATSITVPNEASDFQYPTSAKNTHSSIENSYFVQVLKRIDTTIDELKVEDEGVTDTPMSFTEKQKIIKQLTTGMAIHIQLGNKACTAVLRWVNKESNHFLLILKDQPTPLMVDTETFIKLIQKERIRFIDETPVFERAVLALTKAAA